eukprot:gene10714-12463_t
MYNLTVHILVLLLVIYAITEVNAGSIQIKGFNYQLQEGYGVDGLDCMSYLSLAVISPTVLVVTSTTSLVVSEFYYDASKTNISGQVSIGPFSGINHLVSLNFTNGDTTVIEDFGLVSCYPSPVGLSDGTYFSSLQTGFKYFTEFSSCTNGDQDCFTCTANADGGTSPLNYFNTFTIKLYPLLASSACTNRQNISVTLTRRIVDDSITFNFTTNLSGPLPILGNSVFKPPNGSTIYDATKLNIVTFLGLVQFENTLNNLITVAPSFLGIYYPQVFPVLGNARNATYFYPFVTSSASSPTWIAPFYGANATSSINTESSPFVVYINGTGINDECSFFDVVSPLRKQYGSLELLLAIMSPSFPSIIKPYFFPYGRTNGTKDGLWTLKYSTFFSNYADEYAVYVRFYSLRLSQVVQQPIVIDLKPPLMTNITVRSFGGYTNILRLHITDDMSGLFDFMIDLANQPKRIYNAQQYLLAGTPTNGIYDIPIEFSCIGSVDEPTIYLRDMSLKTTQIYTPVYLPNLEYFPNLVYSDTWQLSDITHFAFEKTVVNVTNTLVHNTLFFNATNANPMVKPKLLVDYRSANRGKNYATHIFTGSWSTGLKMYTIPFTIPMNLFEGQLEYTLLSNPFLQSAMFGGFPNSTVTIISESADLIGPQIVDLVAYPSTSVDPTSNTEFGWDLTIEDRPNGFKEGYVNVTSDLNIEPIRINITNRVSGDMYRGVYRIRLPLQIVGLATQTFTFSAFFVDNTFNQAGQSDPLSIVIDPFFPILLTPTMDQANITITFPELTDTTLPRICAFDIHQTTVDVGVPVRTVNVSFSVCDDDSGVLLNNLPTVYVSSIYNQIYGFKATLLPPTAQPATRADYTCLLRLPYGFGVQNYLYLSVYGIYDNNLNMHGFSTLDLANSSFPYNLTRSHSFDPFLDKHSPIPFTGGDLSIYGYSFGLEQSGATFQLEYQDGTREPVTSLNFFSGIVYSFFLPPFTHDNLYYRVMITVDGTESNWLTVNPSSIPNIPSTCPGDTPCSGHGDCLDNTCTCHQGWTGPSLIDPNSPSISFEDVVDSIRAIVTIVELREIDSVSGESVAVYKLEPPKLWMFTNQTVGVGQALSKNALIGIIVGCSAFGLAAAVVATMMIIKKKKELLEDKKLSRKLSKLSESQSP